MFCTLQKCHPELISGSQNLFILDAEINLLAECSAGKFSMTNISSATGP
jgi:hypothetical protein